MLGQARGTCASGFGTCCVFISDGLNRLKVLDRKVSYLQNPNYPRDNNTSFRETVDIRPMSEKIRQIRLDMIDFEVTKAEFVLRHRVAGTRWTRVWRRSPATSTR